MSLLSDKSPVLVVDLNAIDPSIGSNRASFSNAIILKMNEHKENGFDVIIQSNHTGRMTNSRIGLLSDSYALHGNDMSSLSYKELQKENYEEGFWDIFLENKTLSNDNVLFVTNSENAHVNAIGEQICSLDISKFKQADAAMLQLENFIKQKMRNN